MASRPSAISIRSGSEEASQTIDSLWVGGKSSGLVCSHRCKRTKRPIVIIFKNHEGVIKKINEINWQSKSKVIKEVEQLRIWGKSIRKYINLNRGGEKGSATFHGEFVGRKKNGGNIWKRL